MQLLRLVVGIACVLAFAGIGRAQTPPPDMMLGTVAAALNRGSNWCAVERGTSLFQRSSPALAKISVPEITFTAAGPIYHTLIGRAQLMFTSSTAGKVLFDFVGDYPAAVRQPTFSGYEQTYDTATGVLRISFVIRFPQCGLRIVGVYRT
jgi:hypothetical protein